MSAADGTAQTAREGLQLSGEGLAAMSLLGKGAAALVVVIALILLLAWLVRRLNLHQGPAGQHLQVVASAAVGQRERVVIVQVDDSWLVLGVAQNQVNLLDKRPPPADLAASEQPRSARPQAFATRLAQAFQRRGAGNAAPHGPAGKGRDRSDSPP